MASTKEYLDFVLEQLSGLDEISCRAMMGEYGFQYVEKEESSMLDYVIKPSYFDDVR